MPAARTASEARAGPHGGPFADTGARMIIPNLKKGSPRGSVTRSGDTASFRRGSLIRLAYAQRRRPSAGA
jgi:hypothetical protein